jgi:hypothetical protein
MKTTPKRNRSDSASAAIRAVQAVALGPLKPPKHVCLRDGDLPYWNCIVTARARDTWTQIDLTTAANLARAQADIERLQKELDAEGYVTGGKANPLAALIETLTKRSIALSRCLHVHAEATVGESRDGKKALTNERTAAATENGDLIPTLRVIEHVNCFAVG